MVLKDIARAKINLTLRVLGKLPNGYHALESLVMFADFGDQLSLDPDRAFGVDVTGPFATAIAGQNLVVQAAAAVSKAAPGASLGRFAIDKQIPVAAGLGGGSADAAAALRLLRTLNADMADRIDWAGIAACIGADVPACLSSRPAMVWGYGERLLPVESWPELSAVLVNAMQPAPADKTRRVFAALGAPALASELLAPSLPPADDHMDWLSAQANDLEAPASHVLPGEDAVAAALRQQPGCRLVRMSGAGPTWFAIFDGAAAACAAAQAIASANPAWWVRTVRLN